MGKSLASIELSGVNSSKGYHFIGVRGSYENLTHSKMDYVKMRDKAVQIPVIEQKPRARIATSAAIGGYGLRPPSNSLRPEEKWEGWDVFEIREDEEPVRLYGLSHQATGWYDSYVWLLVR